MKKELSFWKYVVMGVSMLAALPAAYMVGRSVWFWLIRGWYETHAEFWPVAGTLAALASAIVVEGLGMVSLYLWATFRRWNNWKAKKIEVVDGRTRRVLKQGYDLAPENLALTCFVGYVVVAGSLLGVLEWKSDLANFAPVLFPILTAVGGMTWTMFDEHRDRLTYHGLGWNWKPLPAEEKRDESHKEPTPSQVVPSLDETQRAILYAYRDNPALTVAGVGQSVGLPKSTAGRRVKQLEGAGLLRREGDGMAVLWSGNGRHG